jgi:hypothetical protein
MKSYQTRRSSFLSYFSSSSILALSTAAKGFVQYLFVVCKPAERKHFFRSFALLPLEVLLNSCGGNTIHFNIDSLFTVRVLYKF